MNNSIVEKFTKTFFTKQFITFVVIGVINTFSTTVFSTIYKNFIDPTLYFRFSLTFKRSHSTIFS